MSLYTEAILWIDQGRYSVI